MNKNSLLEEAYVSELARAKAVKDAEDFTRLLVSEVSSKCKRCAICSNLKFRKHQQMRTLDYEVDTVCALNRFCFMKNEIDCLDFVMNRGLDPLIREFKLDERVCDHEKPYGTVDPENGVTVLRCSKCDAIISVS